MDIYCLCCGRTLDVRATVCPECRRCPACGVKNELEATACRSCGHPGDESRLNELAQRLDLLVPSNESDRQGLIHHRERVDTMSRIRVLPLVLVVTPVLTVLSSVPFALLKQAGVHWYWAAVVSALVQIAGLRLILDQLRRGRARWMLRDKVHGECGPRRSTAGG